MGINCRLVGLLLLYYLKNIIDPCNVDMTGWIIENDPCNIDMAGWIIENVCTTRKTDIIRKTLYWLFDMFWFKLDIQINLKITDYLEITLY